MKNEERFFGYKAAFGCFIIIFMHLGALGSIGIFMPAISKGIGSSVGDVSLAISCASATGFFCSIFAGKIIQRFTAKWVLFFASLLCATNYFLNGFASNLPVLYISGAFGGFGMGLGTHACIATVISTWFIEKRSTVLGYVFGGAALGCTLFVFMSGYLIEYIGYKNAYYLLAMAILLVTLPTNLALIHSPEKMGQKALGWEKEATPASVPNQHSTLSGVSINQAHKSLSFWLLFAGVILTGMLILSFKCFAPAFWQENGISPLQSSAYLSAFMLISTIATMVSGKIADKFGNKFFISYLHILFIAGMMLVVFSVQKMNMALIILSIFVIGISYPLYGSIPATVTTESFGSRDYSKITAQLMGGFYLGLMFAAPVVRYIRNLTGSYSSAFMAIACMALASMLLILIGMKISPLKRVR